jgi:uncharacterized protein (TIGR04255 family)
MPQYKRPPITEAVSEVRIEEPLPQREVDNLVGRFRPEYPFSDRIAAYGLELDMGERKARLDEQSSGCRLASQDRADVLLVTSTHLSCSRLPPYVGWEKFRERAERSWRTWKSVTGYRKIKRIGVRYINRIDIPLTEGVEVKIPDYLQVYPVAPAMTVSGSYAMQLAGPLGQDNCKLVVNSRLVRSPLVDHVSVVLDIDISREDDAPQRDDEVWALIERIRRHKNHIFEASVTDKARELFNT